MAEWKMYPDEALKLINKYKQFECLWNLTSNEYKRPNLKKNAWIQLSKEFGRNIVEVKKKIKYLRSAYVSERKKVDDSIKSGATEDTIYQPRLFYYSEFSYLDPVIFLRKTASKLESNRVEPTEEPGDDTSGELNSSICLEEVKLAQPLRSPSPWTSASVASSKKPKKKLRKVSSSHSKIGVLHENVHLARRTQHEAIYSVFGKTIALQLGQLTPIEATSTMDEIHRLLSKNVIQSMLSRDRHPSQDTGLSTLSKSAESSTSVKLEEDLHESEITHHWYVTNNTDCQQEHHVARGAKSHGPSIFFGCNPSCGLNSYSSWTLYRYEPFLLRSMTN